MAPKVYPENPHIANKGEKLVFDALVTTLSQNSEVFCNYKFFDGEVTREVDFIVLSPGHGVMFIEVKGGLITLSPEGKLQNDNGDIDPHKQVTEAMYKIRDLVAEKWSRPGRPVFSWMVAFPMYSVLKEFETSTIPRKRIIGAVELPDIKDEINRTLHNTQGATNSREDLSAISIILKGMRNEHAVYLDQLITIDEHRDLLTEEQKSILDLTVHLPSYVVTGPAGSGKTFLALEQARRHSLNGLETVLLCYNDGLGDYLNKITSQWPENERPKWTGSFHEFLAKQWEVKHPETNDSEYWNRTCVNQAIENFRNPKNKKGLPRFDAFVIDEFQDFQYEWLTLLTMGFQDPNAPTRINAFGDIDQSIFPDDAKFEFEFPRLSLNKNLRSTRNIVECASALLGFDIPNLNIPGPNVKFIQCKTENAQETADELIDELLFNPYDPEQLMLLTTNHRHPEHKNRVENHEKLGYWQSYYDNEEVFYSHVSSFKGLERNVVVVSIDGWKDPATAREALYVAITRARDALFIVGDLDEIRDRFNDGFANYLALHEWELTFEN